jgi:hypothetical protein
VPLWLSIPIAGKGRSDRLSDPEIDRDTGDRIGDRRRCAVAAAQEGDGFLRGFPHPLLRSR